MVDDLSPGLSQPLGWNLANAFGVNFKLHHYPFLVAA
jgi:hypothetical protein